MNKKIPLLLCVILSPILASWNGPILLRNTIGDPSIQSVYRDPTSSLLHFSTHDSFTSENRYFAVSPNGTIVHQTLFARSKCHCSIIRGVGSHLFLAMPAYKSKSERGTVHFAESLDGGETWKVYDKILPDDAKDRTIEDMLYIVETGRIFIFFVAAYPDKQLKVISRAPGSSAFSAETIIANNVDGYQHYAKAAYSFWLNKPVIHVTHLGFDAGSKLMYTRSHTNGVSWMKSRDIAEGREVGIIANMMALGKSVYIAYSPSDYHGRSKFAYSNDYGETFNSSVEITKAVSTITSVSQGLAGHEGEHNVLASLFVTNDATLEFALWNPLSMKADYRDFPSFAGRPASAAVDLEVKDCGRYLQMNVTALFTARFDQFYQLHFARAEGITMNTGTQEQQRDNNAGDID